MHSFGYKIVACLVTDIDPDAKVKFEMNEVGQILKCGVIVRLSFFERVVTSD